MKKDHHSYKRNFCSCEKKALKKKLGLYGIQTLDLCDTGAALYQANKPTAYYQANKPTASRSLNWLVINS